MNRRTLLRWLATAAGTMPFPAFRAWAQTASFPGKHGPALSELAAVVLPAELGRTGTDHVAEQFERWVREYRPGADMEHGYGFTRVRSKPQSPGPAYLAQLEGISGALAGGDHATKRKAVEDAIERAGIKDLPRSHDGKHVIADLMSFYFHGSDANDLCYRAGIRRDSCRGLEGSGDPPPPLKGAA
jgi:hypothetical protein